MAEQCVTSRLETSRYRDFSQFFESIGLGLQNLGLEKKSRIGLENIWSQKSLGIGLEKIWSRKKVSVTVSKILVLIYCQRHKGQGIENFDSFNTFSSKQKLQQAL